MSKASTDRAWEKATRDYFAAALKHGHSDAKTVAALKILNRAEAAAKRAGVVPTHTARKLKGRKTR